MELNLFPFPAIDILRFVCQQLDNLKIEYIITGSVAMTLYGTARQTRDIDIIVNLRMEDAESFISIFKGDYYLNPDTVKEEIKRRGMFNIISQTTRFKLDFILKKTTEFTESEFQRKKKLKFLDLNVWVISIEDLILSKLMWIQDFYSELHERDILWIMESKPVDLEYIGNWIKKLNLKTYNTNL